METTPRTPPGGSRGGAGEVAAASLPPRSPPRRLSSVRALLAKAGDRRGGHSPRSLLSRLLQRGERSRSGFGCRVRLPRYCASGAAKEEKSVAEDDTVEEGEAAAVVKVVQQTEPGHRPVQISSGEKQPEESLSVNLGLAASLAFLMSKSATELDKMAALRTQMEALLLEMKRGTPDNNLAPSFRPDSDSDSDSDVSATLAKKQPISCADEDAIDEMEAELQVELTRLQFGSIDEECALPPNDRPLEDNAKTEASESLSASCIDDDGGGGGDVKDSEMVQCDGNEDEEEDVGAEKSPPHSGVSARELERRLHELLHDRHQERIVELESALECAEKQLHDKEQEIRWWRDTAKLVSHRKDDSLFR